MTHAQACCRITNRTFCGHGLEQVEVVPVHNGPPALTDHSDCHIRRLKLDRVDNFGKGLFLICSFSRTTTNPLIIDLLLNGCSVHIALWLEI
jgi:hypothetical protein